MTSTETTPAAAGIGARIKAARLAKRLTLEELAAACGVTKGYLSKVERDHASASVATLIRVCAALDIPVGSLFEAAPAGEVVRAGRYPAITFGGSGMVEHLLTPQGERRVQVLLSTLERGGGSGAEPYALPVDVEFALVLEGALRIDFDGEGAAPPSVVRLEAGDAFTFSPRRRHTFAAAGEAGARVLWVLAPALPAAGRRETEPES